MGKRRSGGRRPYDRVLIVTEGSETEPRYFRDLCADPEYRLTSVDVDGSSDSNPMSVVDHGLKRFEQDGDYDRLYCVFDRDRHDEFDKAIEWLRNMRENEEASVYWTFSVRWKVAQNTNSFNPSTLVHRLVSYLQDIRS